MNEVKQSSINVYYNSACTVCRIGINAQMKKMKNCNIQWKDIHSNNLLVKEVNTELKTVRKYLYLTDNNQLYIGIDAFIKIWQNSPKEQWKAQVLSLPVIKQLSRHLYYIFANTLYLWNKGLKKW